MILKMEERFDYNNYVHKTAFGDVLLSGGKVSTIPTYLKFKCNIWFHNDILIKNHSDNDFIIGKQYTTDYIFENLINIKNGKQ